MNAQEAAKACREAERNYEAAFRDYFANEIDCLPDERFWQLQVVFAREVVAFRCDYGRSNGVGQAARELFRKPLAHDFKVHGQAVIRYSMHEAIRFAKTWRDLTRRLYQPLFDVVQDRGDDAYSDLLDALPLAGRELVQKSLDHELGNNRQFGEAVHEACHDRPQLAGLILRGENYVAMSLSDAARDYFAIVADEASPTA